MAGHTCMQGITASDLALHGRGCGYASLEWCVVVSADHFKMVISIYSFNYLNVLEVKCCPNKGNDFIVHFMIYMFNMNATMQA